MTEQLSLGQPSGATRSFRVTARDKQILRWIGRLRMVTAAQVAESFGLGRAVTYARLSGLVQLGLLDHQRIFHGRPGVYVTTRVGLALVDVDLPPARVDLRTYAHDLELSSLVIELEREFGPKRVNTEREMRAADTPLGTAPTTPRFAVALSGARGQLQLTPAGHPRLHFPDCAIAAVSANPAEGVLAIELERSAKGRARLRRILAGYIAARHIGAVRYCTVGRRVRELVESEVAAQRADGLIEVREWQTRGRALLKLDSAA